jgi:diphosphoinositol-polyphosphate diphosphatase
MEVQHIAEERGQGKAKEGDQEEDEKYIAISGAAKASGKQNTAFTIAASRSMAASCSKPMEARTGRSKQRYNENGERLISGVVPTNEDKTHVLLIQSTAGNEWIFPKGGWESDEECTDAAEREAWEEAGIICQIDHDLGYIADTRTAEQISEVAPKMLYRFYEATVTEEKSDWPEKHRRDRKWVSFADAAETLKSRPELVEALTCSSIKQ